MTICETHFFVRTAIFVHFVYRGACWLGLAVGFSCALLAHFDVWYV